MTWYQRLVSALTAVTTSVSHGSRLTSDRYIVWQEDGGRALNADDAHTERVVTGSIDLYSKRELDPWVEAIESSLDTAGIAWSPVSVGEAYEEETGFWHWSWDWEVVAGG